MPIDALSILCAQLTRDLLAIAKLLFDILLQNYFYYNFPRDSRRGVVLVACVCNLVCVFEH